jgi:hypothetical protein
MNEKQIIEMLLNSSARLRIDDVTIRSSENLVFKARGSIWREDSGKHFVLHLATIEGGPMKHPGSGFYKQEQFWAIEGIIEEIVAFSCAALPSSNTTHDGARKAYWAEFRPCHLSLSPALPKNWLEMQQSKMLESHANLAKSFPQFFSNPWDADKWKNEQRWSANVVIPGVKLVHKNQSTTVEKKNPIMGDEWEESTTSLGGEWRGRRFGVVELEGACEIVLREEDFSSATPEQFENEVQSLITAIAFANGWEPWSQRRTIRWGTEIVLEEIASRIKVPVSKYAPLSERSCYFGADPVALIGVAWDFFREDPNSTDIVHALHLIRQATRPGVPLEIGLLAQCTVFEGVVDILYARIRVESCEVQNTSFAEAKKELLCFIDGRRKLNELDPEFVDGSPEICGHWKRLRNVADAARLLRHEDKFRVLCRHLSLSEQSYFQPVLKEWKRYRNALAHGRSGDRDIRGLMLASSRIAGAQYIMLAKMFGYSGQIIESQMEDKETAI